MSGMQTKMVQLADWIYAIDQQMVRAYVLVGKQQVLCLDTSAFSA